MTSVFEVDINVLVSHSTTIKVGYEPVVHTGAIRQSAKLIEIKSRIGLRNSKEDEVSNVLRTGDKAIVVFQFKFQPEYLKKGSRVLFCEGKTKIIGVVL
jgi:GTPase